MTSLRRKYNNSIAISSRQAARQKIEIGKETEWTKIFQKRSLDYVQLFSKIYIT